MDDRLWEEVARMRCEENAMKIYRTYHSVPQLRTPGDVLRLLMGMRPYPIPTQRRGNEAVQATPEGKHPGPWTSMRVAGAPQGEWWDAPPAIAGYAFVFCLIPTGFR